MYGWCRIVLSLIGCALFQEVIAQTQPEAFVLQNGAYFFHEWSSDRPAGSYPPNLVFQQYAADATPKFDDEPVTDWLCSYNIATRSRITGLGENGVGFINTSDTQDSEERCGNGTDTRGGKVGIAVLALDTRGREQVEVEWKARLISQGAGLPTPREYRLTAQYRVDSTGEWKDLPASSRFSSLGRTAGSFARYNVILPEACNDKAYVQVRWKYYQENGNDGGARPMIALDDVRVFSSEANNVSEPVVFANRNELPLMGCLQGSEAKLQMFEVEGRNLLGVATISAPSGFSISLNPNGPFSSQLQCSPLSGTIFPTQVYVQYNCEEVRVNNGQIRIRSAEASTYIVFASAETYPKLYINEVVTSNLKSYQDPTTSDYPDWIEIYNPNDFEVNLSNYFMSDDFDDLTKDKLLQSGSLILAPNTFKVFSADGSKVSPVHLGFSLSSSGEQLALVGKDGATIIDSLSVGNLPTDISYGRKSDGSPALVLFETSTAGATNNASVSFVEISKTPTFSFEGGVYGISVPLIIRSNNPDAVIIYTTDGSEPDINNLGGKVFFYKDQYPHLAEQLPYPPKGALYRSIRYFSPLDLERISSLPAVVSKIQTAAQEQINESESEFSNIAVIKARVYEPGKLPSQVVTHSYIPNSVSKQQHQLNIISISTQADKLFEYNQGIYVPGVDFDNWRLQNPLNIFSPARPANYTRRGRAHEVQATMEIMEPNSLVKYKSEVGLRIHGNWSRAYPIKSFRVYARKAYQNDFVNYPIFDELPRQDFKTFLLRNSGQDYRVTYMKDAFSQVLINHLNIDMQAYKPYVTYINGEFWGILNARERIDQHYLRYKYQVEDSNFDLLQNGKAEVVIGNDTHYRSLLDYIRNNDISSADAIRYVETQMDIENFIDHMAIKIFYATIDWPHNNVRFWRYKTAEFTPNSPFGLDGRWRWIMFDNDSGLNDSNFDHNTLLWATDPNGNDRGEESTFLFRSLMTNPLFRKQFYTRYADLLNSAFVQDRMTKVLKDMQETIRHDFKMHINRYRYPLTEAAWDREVQNNLQEFINVRRSFVDEHNKSYFGFNGTQAVSLDVNDRAMGSIKINTLLINERTPGASESVYPWTGMYYTPMDITCLPVAKPGHVFSYWELDGRRINEDTLVFNFNKASFVKAFFEPGEYPYFPSPHDLTGCPFALTEWGRDSSNADYSPSVAFVTTQFPDSRASGEVFSYLQNIAFDHTSRTRINGLDDRGLSFINTTNANNNYQPTRLGGMVIGLQTTGVEDASIEWISETIKANSKAYNIRLQYRIGDSGPFTDLNDERNRPIEYKRNKEEGIEEKVGPFNLPKQIMNLPYVQILFRYYYTGQHDNPDGESRDEIRIDDIIIKQKTIVDSAAVGPYTYRLTGNPNALFYQWFSCKGDSLILLEGENSKDLFINEPGNYALAVNYGDCLDISPCEYVYVKRLRSISDAIEATLFPNPTSDKLTVSFTGIVEECSVRIFDTLGQLVHESFQGNKQFFSVDMSQFAAGTYFVQITDKQERFGNYKVVKQ
jgi:hypothetical protein